MNKKFLLLFTVLLFGSVKLKAQESSASAQANNPLANMTAVSFQNYYIPQLTNAPKESYLNTTWVRFAKPLASGKFLMRVSAPMSTIGAPDLSTKVVKTVNGLGDVNALFSYNFISNPTTTMGAGPMVVAPTAAEDMLGSGKWQGGMAFVAFFSKSPVFQYGSLVTWQTSFAGDKDRAKTSLTALQAFYFWQLGNGTYLRGAPTGVIDFKNDAYHFPLSLGIGKVVKLGKTVFNMYIEPQYTVLHKGVQPQFQLMTGINVQFMN